MKRRRSRRSRRYNNHTFAAIALFLLAGVALAGMGWTIYQNSQKPKIEEDNCISEFVEVVWTSLLDCSPSRWGKKQQRSIKNMYNDLWYNKLEFNTRWTLVTTQEDKLGIFTEAFQYCRVARKPEDFDPYDLPRQTRSYIRKKEREVWEKEIEPQIDGILNDDPSNYPGESPILEKIQEISRREDFSPDIPERHLDIVSDLYQQSDLLDFEDDIGIPSFEYFRHNTSAFEKLKPRSLEGVKVRIFLLIRNHLHYNEDAIVEFFTDYFTYFGAEVVEIVRLTIDTQQAKAALPEVPSSTSVAANKPKACRLKARKVVTCKKCGK